MKCTFCGVHTTRYVTCAGAGAGAIVAGVRTIDTEARTHTLTQIPTHTHPLTIEAARFRTVLCPTASVCFECLKCIKKECACTLASHPHHVRTHARI